MDPEKHFHQEALVARRGGTLNLVQVGELETDVFDKGVDLEADFVGVH